MRQYNKGYRQKHRLRLKIRYARWLAYNREHVRQYQQQYHRKYRNISPVITRMLKDKGRLQWETYLNPPGPSPEALAEDSKKSQELILARRG